MTKFMQNKYR